MHIIVNLPNKYIRENTKLYHPYLKYLLQEFPQ
jgi:hypothetical protein